MKDANRKARRANRQSPRSKNRTGSQGCNCARCRFDRLRASTAYRTEAALPKLPSGGWSMEGYRPACAALDEARAVRRSHGR